MADVSVISGASGGAQDGVETIEIVIVPGDIIWLQYSFHYQNTVEAGDIEYDGAGTVECIAAPNRVGNDVLQLGFYLLSGLNPGTANLVLDQTGANDKHCCWTYAVLRGADPNNWEVEQAYEANPGGTTYTFTHTPEAGSIFITGWNQAGQVTVSVTVGTQIGGHGLPIQPGSYWVTGYQLGDGTEKNITFWVSNTLGRRAVSFVIQGMKPSVVGMWMHNF